MAEEPRREAWCERLYRSKAAALLLYGRSLGLSHGEAEDVLQETFVALLRMETEPGESANYAVRTYRNRALNFRRGWWRRVAREFESRRWFEKEPGEPPLERDAMRCLANLPPEQREVIVLKIWHELTFEVIGQLTEVSPNTAAGRYRYGIERLRRCLRGVSDHETDESPTDERNRADFGLLEAPATLTNS